jgi:hypothetical protein
LISPSNDEANSEEMASGNISTASPQKQKKVSSNVFGFNDPKCKQKRVDKFMSVPIPMTAQVMGHYKSEDGKKRLQYVIRAQRVGKHVQSFSKFI